MKKNLTYLIAISLGLMAFVSYKIDDQYDSLTSETRLIIDSFAVRAKIKFLGEGEATINWGDGNIDKISFATMLAEHEYSSSEKSSNKVITIRGGELFVLYCPNNDIINMNIDRNTELRYLICAFNKLKSLDVSKNSMLEVLYCMDNKLTSLDLSKNSNLSGLYCSLNKLTSLNIDKNINLKTLFCSANKLTSLNVALNINLDTLNCNNNKLSADALNYLFISLPLNIKEDKKKVVYIGENPGTNTCNTSLATERGWEVFLDYTIID